MEVIETDNVKTVNNQVHVISKLTENEIKLVNEESKTCDQLKNVVSQSNNKHKLDETESNLNKKIKTCVKNESTELIETCDNNEAIDVNSNIESNKLNDDNSCVNLENENNFQFENLHTEIKIEDQDFEEYLSQINSETLTTIPEISNKDSETVTKGLVNSSAFPEISNKNPETVTRISKTRIKKSKNVTKPPKTSNNIPETIFIDPVTSFQLLHECPEILLQFSSFDNESKITITDHDYIGEHTSKITKLQEIFRRHKDNHNTHRKHKIFFACKHCNITCSSVKEMTEHLGTKKPKDSNYLKNIFQCNNCKFMFLSNKSFEIHLCKNNSKIENSDYDKNCIYMFRSYCLYEGCKDSFNDIHFCKKHISNSHGTEDINKYYLNKPVKMYQCPKCLKLFLKKTVFIGHVIRTCNKVTALECKFCHKLYCTPKALDIHNKKKHKDEINISKVSDESVECNKVAENNDSAPNNLSIPQLNHTQVSQLPIPTILPVNSLNLNENMNFIPQNNSNPITSNNYLSANNLVQNLNNELQIATSSEATETSKIVHTIPKLEAISIRQGNFKTCHVYSCSKCGYQSLNENTVQKHIVDNYGVKSTAYVKKVFQKLLQCYVCKSQYFSAEILLQKHLAEIHDVWYCKFCNGMPLGDKKCYDTHMKKYHSNIKLDEVPVHSESINKEIGFYKMNEIRFACPFCDILYLQRKEAHIHIITCHNVNYNSGDIASKQVHLYVCKKCKNRFDTKSEIIMHIVECPTK